MSENQTNQNPSATPERDARGRFAKGNSGGPGNPYAREVAHVRKLMFATISDEQIQALILKLLEMAMDGNVPAAKLLLSYLMGKPTAGVNPDQVDVDEWELGKKTAQMYCEIPEVMTRPEPSFSLDLTRVMREGATEKFRREIGEGCAEMDREQEKKEARRQKRRQKKSKNAKAPKAAPSPNGNPDESAPSTNGNPDHELPLTNGDLPEEIPPHLVPVLEAALQHLEQNPE